MPAPAKDGTFVVELCGPKGWYIAAVRPSRDDAYKAAREFGLKGWGTSNIRVHPFRLSVVKAGCG